MTSRRTIVIALTTLLAACTSQGDDSSAPTFPATVISSAPIIVVTSPPTIPPSTLAPITAEPPTTTTAPAPTTSTYASWVDVVAAQSSGVFRILNSGCDGGTFGGTGFLVAPGVIATAAHVVDGSYGFTIDQVDGGPWLSAIPFAVDVDDDVALLSAPSASGFVFSLADHEPRSGTTVGLIGFSDGIAPSRPIRGDVGQINLTDLVIPRRAFQHNLQTNGGDSGSPILNTQTGEVLGVHVAERRSVQGYEYAVYLDALRALLAQAPTGAPLDGCNLGAVAAPTTPAPTTPPTTVATTPVTSSPSTTVLPGPLTYRVLLGDTVFGIARAFNTTVDAVYAVNSPSIRIEIQEKEIIRLPVGARPLSTADVDTSSYTVVSGDTIIGIAKAAGTTPAPLLAVNGKLSTPDELSVGQVLLIPQF